MDFKQTTNKLGSSRLLKLALIGIGTLLFIKIMSYTLIAWIIFLSSSSVDPKTVEAYGKIVDVIDVPISTGISAIVVAIIGRYGFRESAQHFARPTSPDQ